VVTAGTAAEWPDLLYASIDCADAAENSLPCALARPLALNHGDSMCSLKGINFRIFDTIA
jgi:hypothetical protein